MPAAAPEDARLHATARYLGVVQFFLVLTWTVYAAYLPELLAAAGLGRGKAPWVLLGDQLLFCIFDVAAGLLADRAFRAYARLGPWLLGATLLSCTAFLALPWVSPLLQGTPLASWQPALLLGLTGLWVATSAALRAPVFALLARHAQPAATPRLAASLLLGMGLAAAISPYLGQILKGVGPALPFALSSLTLLAVAGGLIAAERQLGTAPATTIKATPASLPAEAFFPLLALAALAFQVTINLNATPRYLQNASPADLPWLMPIFWVGFNLMAFTGRALRQALGRSAAWQFTAGCLLAALGAIINANTSGLGAAIAGQLIAGLGWGSVMAAAFGLAAECGQPGRIASATGLLFAMLALATLSRIGINLLGWPKLPEWHAPLALFPVAGWLLVAVLAGIITYRRHGYLSSQKEA